MSFVETQAINVDRTLKPFDPIELTNASGAKKVAVHGSSSKGTPRFIL